MARQLLILLLGIMVPLKGLNVINADPPNWRDYAKMARYIIHNTDWVTIGSISTIKDIESYPITNIMSMVDGPVLNGTGVPYLYITVKDITAKDFKNDNRCSILATLAETDYCKRENYDQEDPRCPRLIMTGHLNKVVDEQEKEFGMTSMLARHPQISTWPKNHDWFLAKVDVNNIILQDQVGGYNPISVKDYFAANDDSYLYDTDTEGNDV